MQNNRLPITIGAIALVLICLCAACAMGAYYFFSIDSSTVTVTEPTPIIDSQLPDPAATQAPATDPPSETQEATQAATESGSESTAAPTESGAGDGALDPEILASMDEIHAQVIAIRGLQPSGEVTRHIYTEEELRQVVIDDFFGDYSEEEAVDDARVLSLLGLLEPGFDLYNLYIDFYSEGIAGYYDDDTQEMVVIGSSEFGGVEKWTYAHEYNHALQDQNYDFDDGLLFNDDMCEEDGERCFALRSLIEGDSTVLELEWFFTYATTQDQQDIFEFYDNLDLSTIDSTPSYLVLDFGFPYNEGYLFVDSLYQAGGWDAVDAAYANPPVTTEQIMHPEKYPDDTPISIELPDLLGLLGDGWELYDENVMGEWYTYLILSQGVNPLSRLSEGEAADAAEGWGGDRYAVYLNPESGEAVLVLKYVWDSTADRNEYRAAALEYGARRFGSNGSDLAGGTSWEHGGETYLFVEINGATIWITAPDAATAEAILDAVQ